MKNNYTYEDEAKLISAYEDPFWWNQDIKLKPSELLEVLGNKLHTEKDLIADIIERMFWDEELLFKETKVNGPSNVSNSKIIRKDGKINWIEFYAAVKSLGLDNLPVPLFDEYILDRKNMELINDWDKRYEAYDSPFMPQSFISFSHCLLNLGSFVFKTCPYCDNKDQYSPIKVDIFAKKSSIYNEIIHFKSGGKWNFQPQTNHLVTTIGEVGTGDYHRAWYLHPFSSICLNCLKKVLLKNHSNQLEVVVIDPRIYFCLSPKTEEIFNEYLIETSKQYSEESGGNTLYFSTPFKLLENISEGNNNAFLKKLSFLEIIKESYFTSIFSEMKDISIRFRRVLDLLKENHFNEAIMTGSRLLLEELMKNEMAHYNKDRNGIEIDREKVIDKIDKAAFDEILSIRSLRNKVEHKSHISTEEDAMITIQRIQIILYKLYPKLINKKRKDVK